VGRNGFPEPLGPLDQGLDEPLHPLSRLFLKQLAVLVEASRASQTSILGSSIAQAGACSKI